MQAIADMLQNPQAPMEPTTPHVILKHMERLLNSCTLEDGRAPQYGVSCSTQDWRDLRAMLPHTETVVQRVVLRAIERYEARIFGVRPRQAATVCGSCVILHVAAQMSDGSGRSLLYDIKVPPIGRITVGPP